MLAALDTIVSFFKMIIGFIILIVNHIVQFVLNIPTYITFALSLVNVIPPFLRWFATIVIIYWVIEAIIGRIRGTQ